MVATNKKKSAGKPGKFNTEMFDDVPVLQRKWQAALRPGEALPRYEDVMLGSLGRLADHIVLLRKDDDALGLSRSGRYIQQWLNDDRWDIPLSDLPPDCATALGEAASSALQNGRPYLASAHCVRDGLVRTYDVLALPTSSRWGGTLVGAYVNERDARYNLLDTIFSATDQGVLSLAAIRDAAGQPADFQIVHLNQGAARLLEQPLAALLWHRLGAGGNLLCAPDVIRQLRDIVSHGNGGQIEIDRDDRSLRLGVTAFGDMLSLTLSDVTALKRSEVSFRLLFDNNPMPMWVFDAETTRFISVNDAAVQHYGYSRETFLQMQLRQIWPQDEWATHSQALQQVGDVYDSGRDWRHLKADGSEIHVLTFGRRVAFDGRDGYLVAVVDITERRKAEARIAHMAHHDGLTNLSNRDFFQDRLRLALERSQPAGKRVAVLCVDLDLFKNVNDSFGHPIGDRLLKAVAERLRSEVRGDNFVARLGGDEFVIVLPSDVSPNEASDFADRLIGVLSAGYDIDGIEVIVGASIGIALSPGDGASCEELMRNADMALYRAKSDGGGVHRFFEREMNQQAQKRRDMERDLRRAFAHGEFELNYQPLVDIAANRISGFESLLRWRHPDKGMVSPAEFIPVAEDIGLIVALGEWVLREACSEAMNWPADIKVAVNLSPVQFRSRHLVQAVISALAHSGLSPRRLELEITESVFLAETEANLAILHQLRELGVSISMDDFGTGYSSLSYLRSFPFDKIKIDRSFVKDLAQRSDCVAIVRAISGLGRSLNITTTAEGVETTDQLDWLRAEGCNEVQGFLFSAARPASEVAALLSGFGRRASKAA
ncbi:EAL domain-containing protein [Bradyrhizobium sp. AUGA SZCCT0240]|uniref:putative bifunctional diguanylate cyclase/phosphodiesterase n=1 Tax=unclassified Bradyrhizobium TaxID=2631580 RepID=UPI001BA70D66|nr:MULTISPECIES: EAL domain-containing protein [unclassified Bradyrhizobium]MBR1198320.1 EAL domain-containing protein [Bradyrhizobium sp. AUGA SZCCT0158]MBR1238965.1 EAL domain-containing protein [Bradyrhizobium sp. AUGA SZCCT0274]MBR1255778.1 EAL domain-containing protein [Bradyrhizobium sp. AUGA SZCCT0240]